jgi:hypothetical protein
MGNSQDSHNAQAGYQGRNHVSFSSQHYAQSYPQSPRRDEYMSDIPILPSYYRMDIPISNNFSYAVAMEAPRSAPQSPVSQPSSDEAVTITCYHVSCKSDKWKPDEAGIGIVLYSYKGQSDWYLNGVHCKSGYIVYKLVKNIENLPGGTAHEKCFRSVFGTSAKTTDPDLIGAGFAYKPGKGFENRSGTFNQHSDKIHHVSSKDRELHSLEFKWIKNAMENWKKGIQNTKVSSDTVSGWELHHDLQ